jgi:phosphoglycolate phosphatase
MSQGSAFVQSVQCALRSKFTVLHTSATRSAYPRHLSDANSCRTSQNKSFALKARRRPLSVAYVNAQLTMSTTTGSAQPTTVAENGTAVFRKLQDPEQELLNSTSVFLFDCDGVIWLGDKLIAGVPETLDYLRSIGKRCFFVTNNSTKSRAGYVKKFTSLGLKISPEEIFSSSFAAAAYLESKNFKATGKKVYIIGEVGIEEELDLLGIPHIGGPADKDKQPRMGPGDKLEVDPKVGAVVVGFDRYFNYYKAQYANVCIRELKAEFIATNTDAVTHLTDAQEWAGNGTMVGAIRGCTQVEPTVVGKPSPLMIDYLANKFHIPKSEICVVGDRLDTDVLFGKRNGTRAVLCLSGVTTKERLFSQDEVIPDFYCESIADFRPR